MVDGSCDNSERIQLRHRDGVRRQEPVLVLFCFSGRHLEETPMGLSDITMQTASAALDGLSMRAKVRANNIANAETPGFRAKRVDFEAALRDAGGSFDTVEYEPGLRNTPIDRTGNSVDLEVEVTELVQDNLMFQAMVNGYNHKAGLLRTAMGL